MLMMKLTSYKRLFNLNCPRNYKALFGSVSLESFCPHWSSLFLVYLLTLHYHGMFYRALCGIHSCLRHIRLHRCFLSSPGGQSPLPPVPRHAQRRHGGAFPQTPYRSLHPILHRLGGQLEAPTTTHFQPYEDKDR